MHKANESDGLHAFVGENSTENANFLARLLEV